MSIVKTNLFELQKRHKLFEQLAERTVQKLQDDKKSTIAVMEFFDKLVPYFKLDSTFNVKYDDGPYLRATISFYRSVQATFGDEIFLLGYIQTLLGIKKTFVKHTGFKFMEFQIILNGINIGANSDYTMSQIIAIYDDPSVYFWAVTERAGRDLEELYYDLKEDDMMDVKKYTRYFLTFFNDLQDSLKDRVPDIEEFFIQYYGDNYAFSHYLMGVIALGNRCYHLAFEETNWENKQRAIKYGSNFGPLVYFVNISNGKLTDEFVDICKRVVFHSPTPEELKMVSNYYDSTRQYLMEYGFAFWGSAEANQGCTPLICPFLCFDCILISEGVFDDFFPLQSEYERQTFAEIYDRVYDYPDPVTGYNEVKDQLFEYLDSTLLRMD